MDQLRRLQWFQAVDFRKTKFRVFSTKNVCFVAPGKLTAGLTMGDLISTILYFFLSIASNFGMFAAKNNIGFSTISHTKG